MFSDEQINESARHIVVMLGFTIFIVREACALIQFISDKHFIVVVARRTDRRRRRRKKHKSNPIN